MISKRKVKRILFEKIRNVWLYRGFSLIVVILILFYLYKNEIIAVAFVNGQPISISEVLRMYNSSDGENVIDKIISEKIIEYEAKKRNIQVKSEEVSEEIKRMEKRALGNGKTMAQLLEETDQTAKELEKNTRLKIMVYKILSEDIDLSEDEVDEYIKEHPELYENLSEEEAREGVRRLLIDAEVNSKYNDWIKEVKASSNIQYFIKR